MRRTCRRGLPALVHVGLCHAQFETIHPFTDFRLLDFLFGRPLVTVNLVRGALSVSFGTANKLVEGLRELGVLEEVTGRRRDRIFRFEPYFELFLSDADEAAPGRAEETGSTT